MSYVTAANMLTYLQILRPDITSVDTSIHDFATASVNGALIDYFIDSTTTLTDYGNLLKYAEVCFYLDECSRIGLIEQRMGMLKSEQMGRIKREYNAGMPMFFFSQGSSRPFMELLGGETYRMKAFAYVRQYSQIHAKKNHADGYWKTWAYSKTDYSERGYNWDATGYEVV